MTIGEVVVAADLAAPSGPAAFADPGDAGGRHRPTRWHATSASGSRCRSSPRGSCWPIGATVVDLADDVIFVAVEAQAAPMVAAAAHDATASILFVP